MSEDGKSWEEGRPTNLHSVGVRKQSSRRWLWSQIPKDEEAGMQSSARTEETRSVKSLRQKRRTCQVSVATLQDCGGGKAWVKVRKGHGNQTAQGFEGRTVVKTGQLILKVKRSHWETVSQGVAWSHLHFFKDPCRVNRLCLYYHMDLTILIHAPLAT